MRMFGNKEIDFIEDFRMLKSEEILVVGNEDEIIDYLIWMTQYKRYQYKPEEIQLPKAIIYDLRNLNCGLIEYAEKRMVSSEK